MLLHNLDCKKKLILSQFIPLFSLRSSGSQCDATYYRTFFCAEFLYIYN